MPAKIPVDPIGVLDACVLIPASLRDTLLRFAETPRLYTPKWSREIWVEVERNLEVRIHLSRSRIEHLARQVDRHFPEALVEGYQKLVPRMTNHPKDWHVLAAAVQCGANAIVTSNLKDFPPASLAPYAIQVCHPDIFLLSLYGHNSAEVESRLHDQASTIGRTLPELLRTLSNGVPRFAEAVGTALGLRL